MQELKDFSSLPLSSDLLTVTQELGYTELTPIQAMTIPLLLEGKDLVGQSKTGSGKTTAFALPLLEKIDLSSAEPQALVLCPTRELATQVVGEIRKLGRRRPGLKVLSLVGGTTGREQAQSLEGGVHIVVGTPGRVLDHFRRERLDLNSIQTMILDEADKMLEMGFEAEIKALFKELPVKRQTAFFSATFPESIQDLSRRYQRNPMKISVEETHTALEQIVYDSDSEISEKIKTLMRVLQQHPSQSTLIFCNMKSAVSVVADSIHERGVSCGALHGDLEQRDRDRVMTLFRNGSLPILVATDVAARGLDIQDLQLVVNFDLPLQSETYVHRIGRTGRAGQSGIAVSIASPKDTLKLAELESASAAKFIRPTLGFKNQYGLNKFLFQPRMQTLMISGGRKDKLRAGDILGALTSNGDLQADEVGKIEISDHFSYVAISSKQAQKAFDCLREGKIKGRKFQIRMISIHGTL